jgi:hypothetical protein
MIGVNATHSNESDRWKSEGAHGATVNAAQGEAVPEWGDLADEIMETLAPQKPAPSFRHQLKRELVEMAHGHPEREVLLEVPSAHRELIIGAAIGSAVALAGGIVYLLRLREHARGRPMGDAQLDRVPTQAG